MESNKRLTYGSNVAAAVLALQFLIWKSMPRISALTSFILGGVNIDNSLLDMIERSITVAVSVVLPILIFFIMRGEKAVEYLHIKAEIQVFPLFSMLLSVALTLLVVYAFRATGISLLSPVTYAIPKEIGNMLMCFALNVLLIPIGQEFFFRGVVFSEFLPYGRGAAIMISALTCAALSSSVSGFIYDFIIGFICAFFVYRVNSLWVGIFIHILSALTLFVASFISSRGIYDEHSAWLNGISFAICMIGAAGIIFTKEHMGKFKVTAMKEEKSGLSVIQGIFTPCAFAYYILIILYY